MRDRDGAYGDVVRERVRGLGIEEVLTAPQSPWQNPFAERLIGSVRRECLDHVIVFSGAHLFRVLTEYFEYYHCSRPHQSLEGNSPEPRATQMPERGRIVSKPVLGGLHHCYRRAA
jgi:transposase InsO family protein